MNMHTCKLVMNLTTDALTWLKKKVASNCHHHMEAERHQVWRLWEAGQSLVPRVCYPLRAFFKQSEARRLEQIVHDLVQRIAQMEEDMATAGQAIRHVLRRQKNGARGT